MDEPLTMDRGGQTYYYHRDALGSITEVSDSTGTIVERYEYDVYGEFTIYDASDSEIAASAIGNPYLFTARRYDAESGNYYYRARYYSHELGRFLSQDPLGFDAGDYNLYRYVFNNPINATDPTGEVAWFIPMLASASAEAIADALMQATVNYFFDPNITTVAQAFESIDPAQVGVAFLSGLIPGGRLLKSAVGATGQVLLNYLEALSNCVEYTPGQALFDFAFGLGFEVIGSYLGDAVAKWGPQAAARGLRKLGFDDEAEKLLRNADEFIDSIDNGKNDNNTPSPGCAFNSFSADTEVATQEGAQAINTLEIGDMVLAYNEATGEIDYYPVIATISHEDPVVQYLTIDGENVVTTPNHPFYTTMGEWVTAGELQIGDTILRANGEFGTVTASIYDYQPQYMYNLTIDAAHTYFVGNGEWLVHNAGKCGNIVGTWNNGLIQEQDEAIGEVVRLVREAGGPNKNVPKPDWVVSQSHWGKGSDIVKNNSSLNLPEGTTFRLFDVEGGPSEFPGGRGPRRLAFGGDGSIYYTNNHYDSWYIYKPPK